MNFIRNLSMRGKLIVLMLPALLVIIVFAISSINRNMEDLSGMQQLSAMAELAALGDPLIEALQRERGRSAVLLASQQDSDSERSANRALQSQRQETDRALSGYRAGIETLVSEAEFDQTVMASIDRLEQQLSNLSALRRSVENRSIRGADTAAQYTGIIMEMVNRIPLLVRRASEPELTRRINAYFSLAEAAEMAGRERAQGAGLIRSGDFDLPAIGTISALAGRQQAYLRSAAAMLPSDSSLRTEIEALPDQPASRELQERRDTLLSSPSGMYALDGADWFEATTRRLDLINDIREAELEEVQTMTRAGVAEARNLLIIASSLTAGAIILVLLLMVIITQAIHKQVNQLLDGVRYAMDNKDLSQQIAVTSKDETGTIAAAVNELFSRFSEALLHIDRASVQLATATEETSSTVSQNTGQITEQQQQIEQVAAATEQMSTTSEQISENTQQVADAANSSMEKSQTGEAVLNESVGQIRNLAKSVQEVNEVIEELENRSTTISEVVEVIRKVADQTNLLALNAAIEAARAGEHGRGFAVVADEVRTLAQQTHESTTKIEDIINGFRDITDNASRSITASHKLANETSGKTSDLEQTFSEIITDVNNISEMATQIATASEEQVAVTRELAGNMESVSESAILTLTGSKEINQVTQEQARLARQLQDLANEFRLANA